MIMARRCDVCGKEPHSGNTYTHRGIAKAKGGIGLKITGKTKRVFTPNIQSVKTKVKGKVQRVKVCTRCLRSGKVEKVA
jgi:large subunit ribosomal protein L28